MKQDNIKEKFARKCNTTGRGINEGYVIRDGDIYLSEDALTMEFLQLETGFIFTTLEEAIERAYDLGIIYYTEWNIEDEIEDGFFTEDGDFINN